jgi:putative transposase
MKNLLEIYEKGKIVMILDNAIIHHAKITKEFLNQYTDRLKLEFIPSYSPNLNLIECFWCWMKRDVIRNRFFSKIDEIKKIVKEFVQYVNSIPKIVIDRLCISLN